MMETFGEGYEILWINECGKMYETFKKHERNRCICEAPTTSIAPTVKPVVAENDGVGAGKINVASNT